MKSIVQNYRNGQLQLINLNKSECGADDIIIKTRSSVVSVGTEKSISSLAKKNLLQKAKARPDLVKRVLEKTKTEGLSKTYQDVMGRLDKLTPLGYSACGTVIEVGSNIMNFQPGDFVSVIGAEIASHSSLIVAPEMMCLKLDKDLGDAAAFGMLGIIAMHGLRCSGQQPGSVIAVTGLGILGILTWQILNAYGYQVVGFDPDKEKVEFCKSIGLTRIFDNRNMYMQELAALSNGAGCDATIIAAASKSNVPVGDAILITRNGGKIVVTGVVDIHPDRNELWHKEIELIVSRAGGPGGLDSIYEADGIDLPIQYARWTQKRNLKEFFRLVQEQKINPLALVSSYTHIDDAVSLYETILNGDYKGLAPILYYSKDNQEFLHQVQSKHINTESQTIDSKLEKFAQQEQKIDVIGAGQFARASLLPYLRKNPGIVLNKLMTKTQASAFSTRSKFSFKSVVNSPEEIFSKSGEGDALVIATRHSLHFNYIRKAIIAGYKNIFVEKPMVTSRAELQQLKILKEQKNVNIMVGYNRRYSPHALAAKDFFKGSRITNISYIVNAGFVPPDHWVFENNEGRSRIVGEMCHFFDFFQYITGSQVKEVIARSIEPNSEKELIKDNITVVCKMLDGSVCNLAYYATGDRGLSRETIFISGSGKSVHIDNFVKTRMSNNGKISTKSTFGQKIGYREEISEFIDTLQGKTEPQSFSDLCNVMEVCFSVEELLGGTST